MLGANLGVPVHLTISLIPPPLQGRRKSCWLPYVQNMTTSYPFIAAPGGAAVICPGLPHSFSSSLHASSLASTGYAQQSSQSEPLFPGCKSDNTHSLLMAATSLLVKANVFAKACQTSMTQAPLSSHTFCAKTLTFPHSA